MEMIIFFFSSNKDKSSFIICFRILLVGDFFKLLVQNFNIMLSKLFIFIIFYSNIITFKKFSEQILFIRWKSFDGKPFFFKEDYFYVLFIYAVIFINDFMLYQ